MRKSLLCLSALVPLLAACSAGASSSSQRQAEVRETGAEVMPFDLDRTRHSFIKTGSGGVQTVVALDADDEEQVRLVRGHLEEISVEFAAGRFSDPVSIHGDDMPGVRQLAAAASMLGIVYRDVPGGGEITYTSDDGAVIGYLHDWFDAQVHDHGSDAVSVPFGHTMTEEMWRSHHPGQPYPGDD